MAALLAQAAHQMLVKRGAESATAHADGTVVSAPARRLAAADVVGGGDALVASYLSGYLDGEEMRACLDRGTMAPAFAVARHGDWEGGAAEAGCREDFDGGGACLPGPDDLAGCGRAGVARQPAGSGAGDDCRVGIRGDYETGTRIRFLTSRMWASRFKMQSGGALISRHKLGR